MSPMVVTLAILIVALLVRIPIAFAMLLAALYYFLATPTPSDIIAQNVVMSLASFPLLAVPFFVLAGTIMARGGIAHRIIEVADAIIGHRPGGLGQVTVFNSLLMGGMTGSANADAAIDSKVLVPEMVRRGYSNSFASALAAATGVIAPIIPPGIGLIVYGLLAQVSIGRLFIAGIIPGLLIAIALATAVRLIAARRGYVGVRDTRLPARDVLATVRRAGWALMMPVLLIVGLRMGVFTPTELGAMAAFYALTVGMFAYREIALRDLPRILREAALTNGVIMLIIAAASAFSTPIVQERVPQRIADSMLALTENPVLLLLLINLLLLALGTVFEALALMIMLTPILAPLAGTLGVDPVHFGVIVVLNITIGAITPPIGTVLYTVCSITGSSIEDYSREIVPFLLALIVVLLVVTFVPQVSLLLPGWFMG